MKGGDKTFIRLSNNGKAHWGNKTKGGLGFSKPSLKIALNPLIVNCFFNVRNETMKKAIGNPMEIDPATFWTNLFLYSYGEYISPLISSDEIKARHFHTAKYFTDDLCAITNDGEFRKVNITVIMLHF